MNYTKESTLDEYINALLNQNGAVFVPAHRQNYDMQAWCKERNLTCKPIENNTGVIVKHTLNNPTEWPLFVIADGSNLVYRAFHAMVKQDLRSFMGTPTGAVYAFKQMINVTIKDLKPDAMLIVFDGKGPTFRHDMYPRYKADRKSPADLKSQWEHVFMWVKAMGIAIHVADAVEADDVIASLVYRFEGSCQMLILSNDKDLQQVITDDTNLYDTKAKTKITPEKVMEKYGIPPRQISDYLALMGDTTDNIPGAKGVGDKISANLLKEYHSAYGVVRNVGKIENRSIRLKVNQAVDDILLSYELTKLRHDLFVADNREAEAALHEFRIVERDVKTLKTLYKMLDFKEDF